MFAILCAILLLILILFLLWYLMAKVVPDKAYFFLGIAFILAILVVNFISPEVGFHTEIWLILSVPLSPFGLPVFLLFLSLFKVKKDKLEKPGRPLITIAFVIIFLSSQPTIAYQLAQWTEQEMVQIEIQRDGLCNHPCENERALKDVRAIALLGQDTTEPWITHRTQIQLTEQGDRILYTDHLYDEQRSRWGNNPIVIVCAPNWSGITGGEESQRSEAQAIARLLRRFGVPENRIELRGDANTLRKSAEAVKDVLSKEKIADQPILLVTSALRMRRAAKAFRKLEMKVIARPSNFRTFSSEGDIKRDLGLRDFLPSLKAYQITDEVFKEYFATMY
ncbi:MAG: ElyC/SanA/YdcF family protein, partial [Spirulinaceae cyanobacterium]